MSSNPPALSRRAISPSRPLSWAIDALVRGYQRWISPLSPPSCRFSPTCSCYARDALAWHPIWRALPLIVWRILRCQPLCAGGFDPVPPGPYGSPAPSADGALPDAGAASAPPHPHEASL